ncbi:MAG: lytic transglycosylase domain-containing protein [Muribaculaceae bacterium]|nr:lytic transglycosylase domain-containing protein [Muribaculaceae bacterium]
MKKYIVSIILFGAAAAATPIWAQQTQSRLFSKVVSPDIPASATLCGKKVDLDRTDMYERFDRELTSMAYTHGTTLLTIKRANKLFPVMAPILKKNGVPQDMLYLACVESSLNTRALSAAKAGGIWQFMPATAKQYGLEVSDEVDERYNVEKATAAACRYLKNALAKYGGDWSAVMASYNGGMARISSELEKQQAKEAFDLYLTDETSRYMFRVLAMKMIMENPAAYGFNLRRDQLYYPLEYKEVKVSGPVDDWAAWAKQQGISYQQLREDNPWIRARKLTNKAGKTYTVKVATPASRSRAKQNKPVFNTNWVRE